MAQTSGPSQTAPDNLVRSPSRKPTSPLPPHNTKLTSLRAPGWSTDTEDRGVVGRPRAWVRRAWVRFRRWARGPEPDLVVVNQTALTDRERERAALRHPAAEDGGPSLGETIEGEMARREREEKKV